MTMIITPEDEFDIVESFRVMDEEQIGQLTLDQLETLCLGLGYREFLEMTSISIVEQPQQQQQKQQQHRALQHLVTQAQDALRKRQQQQQQNADYSHHAPYGGDGITLDVVLELLSKRTRDRKEELKTCFRLVKRQANTSKVARPDEGHEPSNTAAGSNKIGPRQLMSLAAEMGDPLSSEEARAMLEPNGGYWNRADFERLLSNSHMS